MQKELLTKLFIIWFNLFAIQQSKSQIGIGTTTPRGALEINSSTTGFVPPQVALTATNVSSPVVNPQGGALVNGTMVYNTATAGTAPNNVIPGYYYWNGTNWLLLSNPSAGWSLTGNTSTNASTNFIGTTDAIDFVTRTNNSEKMRVSSSGNVGIGTVAPSKLLEVGSSTAGSESAILIKGGSGAAYNPASVADYNGGVIQSNTQLGVGQFLNIAAAGSNSGNWASNILFHTRNNGGTNTSEKMRIIHNGNVGIGTTTPASRLDIATGTTTNHTIVNATGSINDFLQFNIRNGNNGIRAQSGYAATADNGTATTGFAWMGINNSNFNFLTAYNIGVGNDVSYIASGQDMHIANANNTKSIIFSTGTATSPFFSERMRITSTGNVGIGTANPTSRLTVNGAATNASAHNAAAGTTIDFALSNLVYTTANAGNSFTLNNLRDGGIYTLAIRGTTSGTASFTAAGFTFKSANNGATTTTRETIYTFLVLGTTVYFYMVTGF